MSMKQQVKEPLSFRFHFEIIHSGRDLAHVSMRLQVRQVNDINA
jgi:hypothetical protein